MRPERALLHPLWIGALLTQLVNDHWLKGGGIVPGVVTGKLSDLAVLVVAPPVLAILIRARSARAWAACHVAIGVLFTALELSDGFTALFARLIELFGFSWITWSDWTDLLTLPMLLVSWSVLGRAARTEGRRWRGEHLLQGGLAVAAAVTCLATSDVACPGAAQFDRDVDADGFGWTVDCNDEDALVHPGAFDAAEDNIDQDCDGHDPTWVEEACSSPISLAFVGSDATALVPPAGDGPEPNGSCAVDPVGSSVLAVQLPPAGGAWVGWLTVSLDSDTPHTLSVRTDCGDETSELACAATTIDPLRVLVHTTGSVFLIVAAEGAADAQGAQVTATFEPLLCGDGVMVDPEACDDGNAVSHDGCSAVCELEAGSDT